MMLHDAHRTPRLATLAQHARALFAGRSSRTMATQTALVLLFSFAFLPAAVQAGDNDAAASVDPSVQMALNYKMPENTCKAPVERIRSDGNSNALKYERMTRNYNKCISDYAATLTKDRDAIKAAVSKGVTSDQAAIIQPKVNALSSAITAATSS